MFASIVVKRVSAGITQKIPNAVQNRSSWEKAIDLIPGYKRQHRRAGCCDELSVDGGWFSLQELSYESISRGIDDNRIAFCLHFAKCFRIREELLELDIDVLDCSAQSFFQCEVDGLGYF